MELIQPAVIIAIITALVQAIKQIPVISDNKRWLPTISVFCGLGIGIVAGVFFSGETEIQMKVLYGIMYGLAACGLFDFSQQFFKR